VSRRRLLIAAGVLLVLALGVVAGYVLHVRHEGRNIRGSSTAEFKPTQPPPPKPKEPGVVWPMYGHDAERLRVATGISLAPPFKRLWTFRARKLVEFPPAVAYGRLYFANNAGLFFAVNAETGKLAWHWVSHRCQAMSPAVADHVVYATFLNRPPCNATGSNLDGEIVAFAARSGKVLWRRRIGPSESSPLVHGGAVYAGDWDGRVYAFAERTGRTLWTFDAGGKVKGGVAYAGGTLYVGAYDGHVYALKASTGKLLWKASAQPRLGGLGTFYSTPAVAYDRVYIGATDGKVYSFGARTGELRWSHSTGGYVYSSPAVWRSRVYAGSYSGSFYCFDAATGDVRWEFHANGPISGSPTIVAGRVYFATLKGRTYALDARTGRQLWTFPDGKYSPVVADAERLYLVGYTRLYGLERKASVRSAHALRRHGGGRVHRVSSG
jgi:outer membrane protein assembly factor BamB